MNNTWTLEDLYRGIARQWRALLIVVVVFVAGAVAAGVLWPTTYQASALLTVEPLTTQAGKGSDPVNMDTERVVATSTEVLAAAVKKLPSMTLDEVKDAAQVTVPKNAQVLNFTFTSNDPQLAADAANAIANAYSSLRVATAQNVVNEAMSNLTARMDALTAKMDALPKGSSAKNALDLQLQALQQSQATLASSTFYSGALVSPAARPTDSTKPSMLLLLAAGLFLGVLIGMFTALIRARVTAEKAPAVKAAREPELRFTSPVEVS